MFTIADIKALHKLCLTEPSLPTPPRAFETLSGNGLITEKKAREEVERLVTGGEGKRTSTFEIAKELELEPNTIEGLLPTQRSDWGRVGASVIVKTEEYEELQKRLKGELEERVVDTAEFCKRCQIDMPLFLRLLPADKTSWDWLGERKALVYSTALWNEVRVKLREGLKGAEFPVDPKSLVEDPKKVPAGFTAKILSDLLKRGDLSGYIEGSAFVPRVYVEKRQDALLEELRAEGVVALQAFSAERIQDTAAWLKERMPNATILAQHVISPVFLEELENNAIRSLEEKKWASVEDPQKRLTTGDLEHVRKAIRQKHSEVDDFAGYLCQHRLMDEVQKHCQELIREKVEAAWKKRPDARNMNIEVKPSELASYITKKTGLPGPLATVYTNLMRSLSREFQEKAVEEFRQASSAAVGEEFVGRFFARFVLYHTGLFTITDKSLRGKLASALLKFGKDSGISALQALEKGLGKNTEKILAVTRQLEEADPEETKTAYKTLEQIVRGMHEGLEAAGVAAPSAEDLALKKQLLVDDLLSQLENSTDISLQLLLVLVLRHAAEKDGLLKASGKNVPKLLKEMESTGTFSSDEAALLNKAKLAATGKDSLSEDEVRVLKDLGKRRR